jgi:hypothetical protein
MLISLSGLQSSGKDTIANHLITNHNFKKESWAGVLKDMCSIVFGWDRTMLEGGTADARKEREVVDVWWAQQLGNPEFTPRWALQNIGTNVMRNHFHDDIWILALKRKLLKELEQNIVITDTRFPNELLTLRDLGCKCYFVKRGEYPDWWKALTVHKNGDPANLTLLPVERFMEKCYPSVHSSEYSMHGLNYDKVFENDDTIEALYKKVEKELWPT